jgi:hypothetical protein
MRLISTQEQLLKIPTADKDAQEKVSNQFGTAMRDSDTRTHAGFEPLRAEAIAYRQKLIRRLPTPPPEDPLMRRLMVGTGFVAITPTANLAAYVDTLSAMLPIAEEKNRAPR